MSTQNTISIKATIHASIEAVWELYTSPQHVTRWNFASADWHCPKAENDLRREGKFVFRMEAKDGSAGFDFNGTYDEVIPHSRIAYTIEGGRKVVVTFNEDNGVIKVDVTFEPEHTNSLELQRTGWQSILDNFKKYVESFAKV